MAEFVVNDVQIRGRDVAEVARAVIDILDFPRGRTALYLDRSFPNGHLPNTAFVYHPRNLSRPDQKTRHLIDTHPDVAIFCPPKVSFELGNEEREVIKLSEGDVYTVTVDSVNVYPYYEKPLRETLRGLDVKTGEEILDLRDYPYPVRYYP